VQTLPPLPNGTGTDRVKAGVRVENSRWIGLNRALGLAPKPALENTARQGFCSTLKFGHWVDLHPVRRPADHCLPKGRGWGPDQRPGRTRAGRPCHVAWASCPCTCPISRVRRPADQPLPKGEV